MGDDPVDLVGRDARVAQRVGHRPRLAAPGRVRRGDVERVRGERPAEDLGDRRRAARAARARPTRPRSTPAPSPRTNPSRVASNGREAVSGESLRFESAVMLDSAATPIGTTGASEPPVSTTSHSPVGDQPERVVEGDDRRGAGGDLGHDRAGQPVLHRQHAARHRPRQRRHRERGHEPRALGVVDVRPVDDRLDAAAAGVDDDADAVALARASSPRSRCPTPRPPPCPAPIARWMNRLIRRAILGSMTLLGSKSSTSAAIWTSNAGRVERADPARAGHAVLEVAPVGLEVVADGHDRAEAGDDGTAREVGRGHGQLSLEAGGRAGRRMVAGRS